MGMLILAAAAAVDAGEAPEQIVERVGAARERLRMWFAIDTLEYLRKGGRIGAARAWMGSALQIKPILTLDEEITPVERVRTRKRVFERLVEYARELQDVGDDAWVVQHIQGSGGRPAAGRATAARCSAPSPLFVSEIGPVIGAHVGPGPARSRRCAVRPESLASRPSGGDGSIDRSADHEAGDGCALDQLLACSAIWRRQSVSSLTRVRSALDRARELWRCCMSMSRRICSDERPGAPGRGAPGVEPADANPAPLTVVLPKVSFVSFSSSIAMSGRRRLDLAEQLLGDAARRSRRR